MSITNFARHKPLNLPSEASNYSLLAEGERIPLSQDEYKTISNILTALRQGKPVTVVPEEQYMTTQQAADTLNVSRPYLVKILENKEIPSITVGNRRRVLAKDVFAYKQKRDVERRKILEEFSNGLYEDGLYEDGLYDID
jgi:excisionase family DNA binding protein